MNKRFVSGIAALVVVLSGAGAVPAETFEGFSLTASAAETYGDLKYAILDDGTVKITDYSGSDEKVIIPSEIDGKSVTVIGGGVFARCKSLKSITIPNGVTSIDDSSFSMCENLESVTIPDSVTSIGDAAFESCTHLTGINIPNSVTSIGSYAFNNCTRLADVTIPEGIKEIGFSVFYDCRSLTDVTIPDSVTTIGNLAFQGCKSLTSITIPASVTKIGKEAFGYYEDDEFENYKLEGFTIKGVKGTAAETYAKKNGFEFIAIATPEIIDSGYCGKEYENEGKNVTWTLDSEGTLTISGTGDMEDFFHFDFQPWYANKDNIKKIIIADGVTSIGDYAFMFCESLSSITIPNSVTSIGENAFFECINLESVTIPNSVTSIGDSAFCRCKSLSGITIPEGVTSLSNHVFSDCFSLTSITIPEGVTSIDDWAFGNCKNLESITIPDSVSDFGLSAFEDTPWIEAKRAEDPLVVVNNILVDGRAASGDVTIPDSVTSISRYAFYACDTLESITIPNSVVSIGDSAFANCRSLSSITIPNSVVSIGGSAFGSCESLSSVTIPNSVTSIGNGVFSGCTSLASVTIPDSVTSIDHLAFCDCPSLKTITIPASVKSIDDEAFGYYFEKGYKKYEDFTIKGYKGTAAETYAKENGFEFIALDSPSAPYPYPTVKSEVKGRQFRLKWSYYKTVEKYGLAVYQNGKWRLKVQFGGNVTSYTSPKIASGKYAMVLCAKVNGKWDTSNLKSRAFIVTIK